MAETNEIVEKQQSQKNEIVQTLTNKLDLCLDNVKAALPTDFNRARFLQNTIALIKDNKDLLRYGSNELLACSLKAAYLGLDFMNKEAYLVPFSGHLTFMSSAKGDCKFVKKYSIRPLLDIYAKCVRKGDELDYGVKDGKPYLEWKPVPFNDSDVVGVFAIAYFSDGGMLYEVMSKAEVDKVRKVSRASSSGPWKDWYESMAEKTALRKLAKRIETDFDNVDQREAWESAGTVDFNNKPEPTEAHDPFAEPTEEKEIVVESTVVEDIPEVEQFK